MPDYVIQNGELQHYGVLGMKWGVRRGNASKAYYKATKKANKLNEKASRTRLKSAKLQDMALRKEARARNEKQYRKARKKLYKANKVNLKSARLQKKAMKWEKKMEKAFAETKASDISPEHMKKGKKYAYMLASA